MRKNNIAAMGDKDVVLAFKAVGVDVFAVKDTYEAAATLKKLARNYAVIFITEDYAQNISELIARYKAQPYPAIVAIPSAEGSKGYGKAQLKKNVEKAIGTDILFNGEE